MLSNILISIPVKRLKLKRIEMILFSKICNLFIRFNSGNFRFFSISSIEYTKTSILKFIS